MTDSGARGLSSYIERLQEIVAARRQAPIEHGYMTDGDRELRCPECGARITETKTMGEAGHAYECSRRDRTYHGRGGRMGPSPANKAGHGGERA